MKVNLAFPYRETDGQRAINYRYTLPTLLDLFPFSKVSVYDSDPSKPFNRAAARNNAVRGNGDADVIVLCDADSIPQSQPLREAIRGASTGEEVHFPFDTVRDLSNKGTYRAVVYNQPLESAEIRQQYGPSEGGCWVFRPEVWWKAGGMDERLTGWGQEDRIFLITSHNLVGKPVIHPGILFCLHHNRSGIGFNSEDTKIFNEYDSLDGDIEGLREYLEKRGSYERI